jgi:hypothetical protein
MVSSPSKAICVTIGRSSTAMTSVPRPSAAPRTYTSAAANCPVAIRSRIASAMSAGPTVAPGAIPAVPVTPASATRTFPRTSTSST